MNNPDARDTPGGTAVNGDQNRCVPDVVNGDRGGDSNSDGQVNRVDVDIQIHTLRKLPEKQRDLDHFLFDSRKWNLVMPYRHDDVVIASYPKSGTTWMQQIVRSLLHGTELTKPMDQVSPWIDYRKSTDDYIIRNVVDTPTTLRRFLKTHLPFDALPTSSDNGSTRTSPAFIYVARDGRDVVWSFYNHHKSYTPEHVAAMASINAAYSGEPFPDFVAENLTETQYFQRWLEKDGYPLWDFFQLVNSYWAVRDHPKVLLVHYNNLIHDRAREIRRIQAFLAQHGKVLGGNLENAVRESSFAAMKAAGKHVAPLGGTFLQQGSNSFFNKGTNGRWKNTLPKEISSKYEDMARLQLGAECAHWLATGECGNAESSPK